MKKSIFLIALLVLFAVSCGTAEAKKDKKAANAENVPGWVTGNSTVPGEICGIGTSSAANRSKARTTALTLGKKDAADKIETALIPLITASGTARQTAQALLPRIEEKESWTSENGILYILVCIDTESFAEAVSETGASDETKQTIVENTDKIFSSSGKN